MIVDPKAQSVAMMGWLSQTVASHWYLWSEPVQAWLSEPEYDGREWPSTGELKAGPTLQ